MTAKRLPPSKLICAIRAALPSGVIAALDNGADLEEIDVHGHPGLPLRTACFEGNLDIVRELLNRGANPDASAADGASAPLRLAIRRGHSEIAALLIERGARSPADMAPPAQEKVRHDDRLSDTTPTSALLAEPADNSIDFSPSGLTFQKPGSPPPDAVETFGTATSAISADLLFLEENEVPPISWETPTKTA